MRWTRLTLGAAAVPGAGRQDALARTAAAYGILRETYPDGGSRSAAGGDQPGLVGGDAQPLLRGRPGPGRHPFPLQRPAAIAQRSQLRPPQPDQGSRQGCYRRDRDQQRQLAGLILLDGGALGRAEPRFGVPSAGLVLEQREIVSLVLVHPDDPGHSGVIEPAGLGQGRLR
jgi:hypothetical protein